MKLIRDNIPDIVKANGEHIETYIADQEEYRQLLDEKLKEEVNEFLEAHDPEELADILEVIKALVKEHNIDIHQVQQLQQEKAQKRGGFEKRIILK